MLPAPCSNPAPRRGFPGTASSLCFQGQHSHRKCQVVTCQVSRYGHEPSSCLERYLFFEKMAFTNSFQFHNTSREFHNEDDTFINCARTPWVQGAFLFSAGTRVGLAGRPRRLNRNTSLEGKLTGPHALSGLKGLSSRAVSRVPSNPSLALFVPAPGYV